MKKEELFIIKMEELCNLGKMQGNILSKNQIDEVIKELGLLEKEKEYIYEYLFQKKIGVESKVDLDEFLTSEDKNYLEEYLIELEQIKKLEEHELDRIMLQAIQGNQQEKVKVLEYFLPQVIDFAKLYKAEGVLLEDLIGEGNVALALAVETLGHASNSEDAKAFIASSIMDSMEEFVKEEIDILDVEQKLANIINEISDAAKELAESLARKITIDELVREGTYTKEEIEEAISYTGNKIEYFEGCE